MAKISKDQLIEIVGQIGADTYATGAQDTVSALREFFVILSKDYSIIQISEVIKIIDKVSVNNEELLVHAKEELRAYVESLDAVKN